MAADFSFTVPSSIPQDLQLIKDILGDILEPPAPQKTKQAPPQHNQEHGTDSDTDSEKEVEADILAEVETNESPPSESTSDSESSSEFESDTDEAMTQKTKQRALVEDEDEEGDVAIASEAQVRTKNEIAELNVVVPDITEIGLDEHLEKVGEVMSIVNSVVIVKGLPSAIANRGSERALDSDTLLVFEDRKVLGYIFETFGPTSEPLYQIRFNSKYPLDGEKVQVGRAVFHVPAKSNYVFVQQLKHFKGSDASNVHDEEPGEDELEFSDDEAEAAYKKARATKREHQRGRSGSVASSRHATPVPSRMRDQDMVEDDPYGASSSTYHRSMMSYNDVDYGAGPSRPAPIPYDDPYSDSYGLPPTEASEQAVKVSPILTSPPSSPRGSGRGRGRGSFQRREDGWRGRGRDRNHNDRARGRGRGRGRGGDQPHGSGSWSARQGSSMNQPQQPRSQSPASLAIARATGNFYDASPVSPQHALPMGVDGGWNHPQYPVQQIPQPFDYSFSGYPYHPVQPHINPRFAANFGMVGMGGGYGPYGAHSGPYSQDASGYSVGNGVGGWSGGEHWGPGSQGPPHDESGNQNA